MRGGGRFREGSIWIGRREAERKKSERMGDKGTRGGGGLIDPDKICMIIENKNRKNCFPWLST